jgi:hypothetical protein
MTTAAERRDFLTNVETFKLEWCDGDMEFVRFLLARSPLKNLNVRGSYLYDRNFLHPLLSNLSSSNNCAQVLKVLDVSGAADDAFNLLTEWILNDEDCKVSHLYMEKCRLIPNSVMPTHLKIQVLSVAGYVRYEIDDYDWESSAFMDIQAWARIPSIREINGSGCSLDQVQRDSLIANYPHVVFDLSKEFRESPRVYV